MAGVLYRGLLQGTTGGGGGGVGGCGVVLPTAWDDNFDCGSAIDTGGTRFTGAQPWTVFGGGGLPKSTALVGGEFRIETTGAGIEYDPYGAYLALPSGDWTFHTYCHMGAHSAGSAWAEGIGFYLAESGTGKSHVFTCGQGWNGGWVHKMAIWNGSTTYANATIGSWTSEYFAYFKLSRVGSTLTYEYSLDNAIWTTLLSHAQTAPFTTAPDRIGIVKVNSVPNVGTTYGYATHIARTA